MNELDSSVPEIKWNSGEKHTKNGMLSYQKGSDFHICRYSSIIVTIGNVE